MRGSDYLYGSIFAAAGPITFFVMDRVSPSQVGKGGFAGPMRLMGAVGLTAGFLLAYSRSISTFRSPITSRVLFLPASQHGSY